MHFQVIKLSSKEILLTEDIKKKCTRPMGQNALKL